MNNDTLLLLGVLGVIGVSVYVCYTYYFSPVIPAWPEFQEKLTWPELREKLIQEYWAKHPEDYSQKYLGDYLDALYKFFSEATLSGKNVDPFTNWWNQHVEYTLDVVIKLRQVGYMPAHACKMPGTQTLYYDAPSTAVENVTESASFFDFLSWVNASCYHFLSWVKACFVSHPLVTLGVIILGFFILIFFLFLVHFLVHVFIIFPREASQK